MEMIVHLRITDGKNNFHDINLRIVEDYVEKNGIVTFTLANGRKLNIPRRLIVEISGRGYVF